MAAVAAVWALLLSLLHSSHALIGGHDAAPGQFPYQVLTRGLDEDPLRNFGTGVLIHPEWVLTNADSVADYVGLMVTLGVVDRDSQDASRQDIPALNVFVHPKWPGQWVWLKSHLNDIGLVQLSRPATLNDFVQVAYLPEENWYKGYSGMAATVGGWGHHLTDGFGYRDMQRMQWETTTVMSFPTCYRLRLFVSEHTGSLKTNHICADTKGSGPCDDDGGAPLVVRDAKKRPVVVGLFTTAITHGEPCQSNYPSVYTRVAAHLDWIRSVVNETLS
ncbi:chymotrypsin-like elastase family member 2A [Thrips palmi]|uniref:Chymotrypsin-like elastase family member 2A n=1 Tax=Thrips palmi TaxID=161013 RepID=A0A6P9A515_THRPL|nr:chymotrypsin-like elastase family member 2A [Thrips palmi]